MYQGEAEAKNLEFFGFDPKSLDAVILSYAHLDHVGRLSMLFRAGYRGAVYATQATFLLMKTILEDALKVMEPPLF
ncbi:MBL fold metallo-hydrolase [Desulfosoma sp.]|uniref:MBL fold metallo-hydrolase n=1 Tax=Desulfosoma sp. TaxID=2603217 RepID=UPI00404974FA